MDYRDERDALRARAESLESELASARAETERMRATENALSAAQRENEKLKAELRRMTPQAPRPKSPTMVLVGLGAMLLATGTATFLLFASRSAPPAPPPSTEEPSTVVEIPATPKPITTAAEGPAPKAEPEKSPRATTVEWPAKVARATGLSFAPGTACTLRATLSTDGSKMEKTPEVEVVCPGKSLYHSTDPLEGMSSLSYSLDEAPGPEDGSYAIALSFDDRGTRSGARTQVTVSTYAGTIVARKDTSPTFQVELTVDELSSAWKGPALFVRDEGVTPAFRKPIRRTGYVVQANGNGLVKGADKCTIDVRPAFNGASNCRVRLRCGEATIYGAEGGGFAACVTEGSSLLSVKDEGQSSVDNDPELRLDLVQRSGLVKDDRPNDWTVTLGYDAR